MLLARLPLMVFGAEMVDGKPVKLPYEIRSPSSPLAGSGADA